MKLKEDARLNIVTGLIYAEVFSALEKVVMILIIDM